MNFMLFLLELAFLLKGCWCDELYTAYVKLEQLLTTQSVLVDSIQEYITITESKLKKLKAHLENFKEEHEKGSENIQEYLGNPINDFLLIKRLTIDWRDVETLLTDNTSSALLQKLTENKSIIFPTNEDLLGAAVAIGRLQEVYDQDTSSLASGKINKKQYDTKLSAGDCYQLGKQLYKTRQYFVTKLWMKEALARYNEEVNKTVRKPDILRYLATASYYTKDYARIPKILDEISADLSVKEKIQTNFTEFKENLLEVRNSSRRGDTGQYSLFYGDTSNIYRRIHNNYEKLCRNEIGIREDIKVKLGCRYTDLGKPFLKLAKLKEEDVFLKPKIVCYHDVISDDEIEVIKSLAMPTMTRAQVIDDNTLTDMKSTYRIGQAAFLYDVEHSNIVNKLNKRVEDMTGLTTATAEALQVVNYGIGGHYETHFDFLELPEKVRYNPERIYSERIATVLFYMNDVELGGATVFPCLNVSVWPKKGTAVIWYNLKLSGAYEMRSQHASCPVLKGFKWICNKWLGEQGQWTGSRPCGLTKDVE